MGQQSHALSDPSSHTVVLLIFNRPATAFKQLCACISTARYSLCCQSAHRPLYSKDVNRFSPWSSLDHPYDALSTAIPLTPEFTFKCTSNS